MQRHFRGRHRAPRIQLSQVHNRLWMMGIVGIAVIVGLFQLLVGLRSAQAMQRPFDAPARVSATANFVDGYTGLGFTGEWHRPDGSIHLRARTYMPEHGRFLQRDPLDTARLSQINGQDSNRYAYVRNTPTGYRDPSGHLLLQEDTAPAVGPTTGGTGGGIGPHGPPSGPGVSGGMGNPGSFGGMDGPSGGTAAPGGGGGGAPPRPPAPPSGGFDPNDDACSPFDIRQYNPLTDREALEDFVRRSQQINDERGYGSISSEFPFIAEAFPQNVRVAVQNGKIQGVSITFQETFNLQSATKVQFLEGTGRGAGTALMQDAYRQAVQNTGGRMYLDAVDSSLGFYQKLNPTSCQDYTCFWDRMPQR